jgi:ubiquinone/menaquinone biosynthesis C-methylase UbiE
VTDKDLPFKHSTPALYDRYMGPLLFEPYARLVSHRAAALRPARVLEIAAGTGILTEALHRAMPDARITATDINPAMLDMAEQRLRSKNVSFESADALALPFADQSFELVVCQFGVMFFPDKVRANREARRVLAEGGHYLLVSFDQLEHNPVPKAAEEAVQALFPSDPPMYMKRGPFSYADREIVERDLLAAGFSIVELETAMLTSQVKACDAARGLVLGSPFRSEIERRDPSALDHALKAVTDALAPWDGKNAPMSAHIATAKM